MRWLYLLGVALAAGLAACAPPPASDRGSGVAPAAGSPLGAGAAPGETPPQPVAIGATEKIVLPIAAVGAPFVPHVLAQENGFFREEGLDADIPVTRSNLIIAGLAAGELGYSGQTSPVVRGALAGIPVRVIGTITARSTRYLVTLPEVQSVPQLRGQAIAVTSIGDGLYNSAWLTLEHFGLDPQTDVHWLGAGGTPERLLAMQQGGAQASVLNVTDVPRAEALGFVPLLRLDEVAPLPESGLAASLGKLETEREQVKRVIRAMVRALQYVKSNREGSLPVFMQFLQLDREAALQAYDAVLPGYSDDGTLPERALRFTIDAEKRQLGMTESVPFSRVANLGPLYEVLAELGITPAPDAAR